MKTDDWNRQRQFNGYSPLTGGALPPQQTGHNSTSLWVCPSLFAPSSWAHLHQSKEIEGKKRLKIWKMYTIVEKEQFYVGIYVHERIQLTSSLVWRVSPLASLIWTHGMDSAWWGIGHMYFTTFDLYLTCTLSESNTKEWQAVRWNEILTHNGTQLS